MTIINKLKNIFPVFYHHGFYEVTRQSFRPSSHHKLTAFEINASNCKELRLSDNLKKMLTEQPEHFMGYGFRDADGSFVGHFFIMNRGGREILYKIRHIDAYLVALRVFDEFRGNSYAGEIASFMTEKSLEKVNAAYLTVRKKNTIAVSIYEKLGFRKIGNKRFVRMGDFVFPYHSL